MKSETVSAKIKRYITGYKHFNNVYNKVFEKLKSIKVSEYSSEFEDNGYLEIIITFKYKKIHYSLILNYNMPTMQAFMYNNGFGINSEYSDNLLDWFIENLEGVVNDQL